MDGGGGGSGDERGWSGGGVCGGGVGSGLMFFACLCPSPPSPLVPARALCVPVGLHSTSWEVAEAVCSGRGGEGCDHLFLSRFPVFCFFDAYRGGER